MSLIKIIKEPHLGKAFSLYMALTDAGLIVEYNIPEEALYIYKKAA